MVDVLKQLVNTPLTANNKFPTGTSNTTLYTVGGASNASALGAMLTRIVIANVTTAPATFRIAISPSTSTVANGYDWVAYDVPIGPNETINLALGCGMAIGDFITVRSSVASALVFSPFGIEVQ